MATLEQRGRWATWVVVDDGCRPATPVEIDLWRENDRLDRRCAQADQERDEARDWARWLRQHGSWPVVGRVLYRLTEFDALDWAEEVEVDRG